MIVPDKDTYLDSLLLGIKDGIRDSITCEEGGVDVYIPDDYQTGYRIGNLIFELHKYVPPPPETRNQEA